MNKLFTNLAAIIAISSIGFTAAAQAQSGTSICPASPEAGTIIQPDGTSLTIVGKGTMLISFTETPDGYTLLRNKKGIYEYAIRNSDGDIISSGIKAHNTEVRSQQELNALGGIEKYTRPSDEKLAQFKAMRLKQIYAGKSSARTASTYGTFPTTGNRKVLMILIEYPDLPKQYPVSNFSDLMNQVGYKGTGSYHDFYIANSYNQLNLSVDVYGWYQAKNGYKYYGRDAGDARAAVLGREAIDAAEAAGVDFSQYDNDGDGRVDGVMFVHSGVGAELGSQTQYIWSHRSQLGANKRTYDGVVINDYMVEPETGWGNSFSEIGVFCHEFGHTLGLPDLYDIDYSSSGLGNWTVMSGGSYNGGSQTPACFDMWSKTELAWLTPTIINIDSTYTLLPSYNTKNVYKVLTPNPAEYFLLENIQKDGYDKFVPGKGLAVWHIDTTKSALFHTGDNSVNADEYHKGITLIQADGKQDLEKNKNSGDAADLFPGSLNKKSIDDITNPNANLFNYLKSGMKLYNITQNADSTITFGLIKKACVTDITIEGSSVICSGDSVTLSATSASTYQWYNNDVAIAGATNQTYIVKTAGKYAVSEDNGAACNDTSLKVTITVSAKPAKPTFTKSGNVLTSSYNTGNQWYLDGSQIGVNGTNKTYTVSIAAKYKVEYVSGGCSVFSDEQYVDPALVGIANIDASGKISVYPNPAQGYFFIELTGATKAGMAQLYDITGRQIHNQMLVSGKNNISTQGFTKGLYLLKLTYSGIQEVRKITID